MKGKIIHVREVMSFHNWACLKCNLAGGGQTVFGG